MIQKSITIINEERCVKVSGTTENINSLLAWIKEKKRGKHKNHSIICDSANDFVACRQKAKHSKLFLTDLTGEDLEKALLKRC